MSDASQYPMYIDKRDAAVVDQLVVGEEYPVQQITRLYKRLTDISRDKTAKRRKDNLLKSPVFEYTESGDFRYVGVGHDE